MLDFDTRYALALYSRSLGSRHTLTDLQPSPRYVYIFTSNATEKSPRLGNSVELPPKDSVVFCYTRGVKSVKGYESTR